MLCGEGVCCIMVESLVLWECVFCSEGVFFVVKVCDEGVCCLVRMCVVRLWCNVCCVVSVYFAVRVCCVVRMCVYPSALMPHAFSLVFIYLYFCLFFYFICFVHESLLPFFSLFCLSQLSFHCSFSPLLTSHSSYFFS